MIGNKARTRPGTLSRTCPYQNPHLPAACTTATPRENRRQERLGIEARRRAAGVVRSDCRPAGAPSSKVQGSAHLMVNMHSLKCRGATYCYAAIASGATFRINGRAASATQHTGSR